MAKHAIILGIGSDIGYNVAKRLRVDSWHVTDYYHSDNLSLHPEPWDVVVCCYGVLEPIGSIWGQDSEQWEGAFEANFFKPLRQIRALYPHRRPGASVCFFSGAGAGGPAPTYSAYAASKVALIKMVELMDDESPDCKFFILGPGVVRTKIHMQTMRAGERAANYERVRAFLDPMAYVAAPGAAVGQPPGTSHDDIYACLMACVAAPKAAVGGRNICVHLDDWSRLGELAADLGMFKLRRAGDADLRKRAPPQYIKGEVSARAQVPASIVPHDICARHVRIQTGSKLTEHRVVGVGKLDSDMLELILSWPGKVVSGGSQS